MFPVLFFALVIAWAGCKTPQTVAESPVVSAPDSLSVQKNLVETYQNGQVTRCRIDSNIVYFGSLNAPDAGAEVFDAYGKKIGGCYFSTNQVHPLCERAFDCTDIYRVEPNIWGQPGVQYLPAK